MDMVRVLLHALWIRYVHFYLLCEYGTYCFVCFVDMVHVLVLFCLLCGYGMSLHYLLFALWIPFSPPTSTTDLGHMI